MIAIPPLRETATGKGGLDWTGIFIDASHSVREGRAPAKTNRVPICIKGGGPILRSAPSVLPMGGWSGGPMSDAT